MKKILFAIGSILVLLIGAFGAYQVYTVQKAHSSFENYYAFRGCTQLLTKTATDATCITSSGQTIKMVLYNGKWYLDGDLPCPGPIPSIRYFLCVL